MATTHFLLESKFNLNPLLQQTFRLPPVRSFPIKLSSGNNNVFKLNYSPYKVIRYSPKLRVECFFMSPKPKRENGTCREDNDLKAVANDLFWRSIKSIQKALQFPFITGVLLGLLFLYDRHHVALAASGGRMGGSSFSSSSSTWPTSSDSSYSSSSSSTWPSWSDSSYWSSSSSTWPSSSNYSYSYSSSTRPSSDNSYSSKRRTTSDTSYSSSTSFGGGCSRPAVGDDDALILLFWLVMIVVAVYLATQMAESSSPTPPDEKTSILKLQVGLLGMGRSLQRDLNRIAETADTSTPRGLSYILQETILALLRHPDYCISGYSYVDAKRRSVEEVERIFNQLSIEERGKFDEETLVNVNNMRKQSARSRRSNGFRNEYIVITIIVAAGGVHKLPPINSSAQLKEALQMLASIPSSSVMAVEVLWTPQNENDTVTEQEYLEDYPLLRPL